MTPKLRVFVVNYIAMNLAYNRLTCYERSNASDKCAAYLNSRHINSMFAPSGLFCREGHNVQSLSCSQSKSMKLTLALDS